MTTFEGHYHAAMAHVSAQCRRGGTRPLPVSREVCQTDFVKLKSNMRQKYLLPDNETIKATKQLAKEGFRGPYRHVPRSDRGEGILRDAGAGLRE